MFNALYGPGAVLERGGWKRGRIQFCGTPSIVSAAELPRIYSTMATIGISLKNFFPGKPYVLALLKELKELS
jgi:hypothetical protein